MLSRNVVLLLSLFTLLVQGDSNDAGIQAMSTDKDSRSDEAPTESMNAVSPDQLDESPYYGRTSDASSTSAEQTDAVAANQVTAAEAVATNSVEEQDEDESSDSDEGGKKKFGSRAAKPQSPAHPVIGPAHSAISPALPSHPIVPQQKILVRSRTSKRRSRTGRRQM